MLRNIVYRKERRPLLLFLVAAILFLTAGDASPSVFAWDGGVPEQNMPVPTQAPLTVHLTTTYNKNNTGIHLTWEPVAGAVSYEILRAPENTADFRTIGMTEETLYKDTDVTRGHLYLYCIKVLLEDGTYYDSEMVSGTCPLQTVKGVSLRRYSSSSIHVAWEKNKNAACYRILVAKGSPTHFQCIGITKKTRYHARRLQKNKNYFFQVQACASRKASEKDGSPSAAVAMQTKPYHRTIVFAGDSITTGLNSYRTIQQMKLNSRKKVVAAIGLNTTTFRTRRCFGGQSGLKRVVSYKPYRLYMMLGINEIHYRSSKDVAAGYRDLINTIQASSPETEIVLLAVSPVTKAECQHRKGFSQIPSLNRKLKKLAEKKHLKYYDYTGFLKDSEGYLSTKYAVADGVHWNAAGYERFGRVMSKYDRSRDQF